jgi:poly(3-hydroxyalkanoate) synthetase
LRSRLTVDGKPVARSDIQATIFAVSVVKDHIAPTAFGPQMHLLIDREVTFLLTAGR